MGEIVLYCDTKATEFGHLTTIDLEIDSVILELAYLSCLTFEYGKSASKVYLFEYGGKIESLDYQNPLEIFGYFNNVSKKSVEWVLARTIFYREEQAKRQAEAAKKEAEAEDKHQSAVQKKLKNLEAAHKLRLKMIKDGVNPDEANQLIGRLLVDQRAHLQLPAPKKIP